MAMFADRTEAGRLLAEGVRRARLALDGALVLGIPRGGVVVAAEVASALGLPLDVVLARKLGAPGNQELALGAVGPDGEAVVDERLVERLGVAPARLEDARKAAAREVADRLERFRPGRPPLRPTGKPVIVVDDGVATGSTAVAAGRWLERAGAGMRAFAVPVASPAAVPTLRDVYDEVIVLAAPARFFAVGEYYADFAQSTDEDVVRHIERQLWHSQE